MPVYDCTFVLSPQLEDAALDNQITKIKDLINSSGGKVLKDNRIGVRRLAYEINKLTQGYYVSLEFEGTGQIIDTIEHQFRLNEACLRFLTCHHQVFDQPPSRNVPRTETRPNTKPETKPETETTPASDKPAADDDKPAE